MYTGSMRNPPGIMQELCMGSRSNERPNGGLLNIQNENMSMRVHAPVLFMTSQHLCSSALKKG
eukprot:1156557-Pelagomonas_calceolata.AAC.4